MLKIYQMFENDSKQKNNCTKYFLRERVVFNGRDNEIIMKAPPLK